MNKKSDNKINSNNVNENDENDAIISEQKEIDSLNLNLEKLKQEAEEQGKIINALKQQCANLINYSEAQKKKTNEAIEYANKKLLEKILTFIDNYQRTITLSKKHDNDLLKSFLEGFEMNLSELNKLLQSQEVEQIIVKPLHDKFDAKLHQILDIEVNDKYADDIILDVKRAGYTLKEKVLRATLVIINKLNKLNTNK